MKYYEWSQNMRGEPDGRETWFIDLPYMDELGVEDVAPIEDWDERLIGTYPPGDCPRRDFPVTANDWPLYSPRLRDLMEDLASGLIRYLPIRLQTPEGEGETREDCVVQYLRRVECIDRERTEVKDGKWEPINCIGDFATRGPLCLVREKIENERLFRIQGDGLSVVIRQDLKEAIEEAGMTGCEFDELRVWPEE